MKPIRPGPRNRGPFIPVPPPQAATVAALDDGDSWWAGQINSIPASSTAISLAVSIALGFQTEDFSPRPMGAGYDSLRTLAIGSDAPLIPTADDDIVQQPVSLVEELEQQNSFVALAKIPVAFTVDDDIVPQPSTIVEEVEVQQYVVVPVVARQVLSADEEIVPQSAPLNIDEDYYQQPAADPFSVRIVSIQTGGSPLLATFNPDEDYELQRTVQWKARWYVLSPDEEISSVAATGFADEDYQVDMQARLGPDFYILPATDDDLPITTDAGVSSPSSFGQRAHHEIGFKRWEFTEELPFSALSIEEADWQAPPPVIPAAKSLRTVDEEIVPQPVPLNIDEFYQLNLYVSPDVYKVSIPTFVENDVPILIAPAVTSLVEWLVRARRRGVR